MANKVHGRNGYVLVNDINLSGDSNNVVLNFPVDTVETTAFGDTAKSRLEGVGDWNMDLDAFFTDGTTSSDIPIALFSLLRAGAKEIHVAPQGSASGNHVYKGSAILTTHSVTTPVGGAVTVSAHFEGSNTAMPERTTIA
jgi:hypothetical protein